MTTMTRPCLYQRLDGDNPPPPFNDDNGVSAVPSDADADDPQPVLTTVDDSHYVR